MTPLSRVAAAIRAQIQCGPDDAMHAARAAVEALLPVSGEMVEAGVKNSTHCNDFDRNVEVDEGLIVRIFEAMIEKVVEG